MGEAKEKNCRLKFVAKLDNGNASVGLEAVSTDHPFYNLVGSDNITVFYTERYKDSPLVVKGAGAGGDLLHLEFLLILSKQVKKMDRIKVFSPGSITNLSCGYDVLGVCLENRGDEIEVIKLCLRV